MNIDQLSVLQHASHPSHHFTPVIGFCVPSASIELSSAVSVSPLHTVASFALREAATSLPSRVEVGKRNQVRCRSSK
ncbi:hypothetical protein Droror1_Dr00025154 [Drosera rotundifolia]